MLARLMLLQIVCLELEPYLDEFVRPFFGKASQDHKLDIRIGDALGSMEELAAEGRTFDVVFLDANKTGYLSYYNLVMDRNMLSPFGFIVVDNALMKVCSLPDRCSYMFPGNESPSSGVNSGK